jgi:putative endonuclease
MNDPLEINRRADGADHEQMAFDYLSAQGYRLVKKNFHFGRAGEIDLILRDGEVYVFVEVKMRRSRNFGAPEDSVTMSKRKQIYRVAEGFVHVMGLKSYEARFDVIAIDYVTGVNGAPEIRHWKNAF